MTFLTRECRFKISFHQNKILFSTLRIKKSEMNKKLLLVFVLLLNIGFIKAQDRPQLITDRTNGKVTIGFDVFTDIPTGDGKLHVEL